MTVEPRVEDLLATIRKAIDDDMNGLDAAASTSGNSQGTLMRGALREMRVNYEGDKPDPQQADREIAELRERISRSRGSSFPAAPAASSLASPRVTPRPSLRPGPVGKALAGEPRLPPSQPVAPPPLRLGYDEFADEPQAPAYAPAYETPSWVEEQEPQPDYYAAAPAYEPPAYQQPIYDSPAYDPPAAAPILSPRTTYQAQNSFQHLAESLMARATGERGIEDMTRDLLRGLLKQWLDDNLPQLVEKLVREEIERVARRGR